MSKIKSNYAKVMILIGITIVIPIISALFYTKDIKYVRYFLLSGLISIFCGIFVDLISQHYNCQKVNGILFVIFSWIWGILFGALPFFLANKLDFIQAVFESISGWTTTGLSVMDVTKTAHIFLFHRSFMQFCGGLGFILMIIVFVKNNDLVELYTNEGHPDKLMPNIHKTAVLIFSMYSFFLLIGIILYLLAGMNLFDSICHSMCSLSTGGFSTKLNSIGEYHSVAIDLVTIFLMIIGTTNFATLVLLMKGKISRFFNTSEVKFMFACILIFTGLITLSLINQFGWSYFTALKHALFDAVSALSTTGYSSMSYAKWPSAAIGLMIILMLIGGGIGSTAGGIKMSRVIVVLKTIYASIKMKLFSSRKINVVKFSNAKGSQKIDDKVMFDTLSFVLLYLIIFMIGSLLVTVSAKVNLTSAMFEFASSIGTVGLSIGITNPLTNHFTLIVEGIGMLLGRLEIYIILIFICNGFKQLKNYLGIYRR